MTGIAYNNRKNMVASSKIAVKRVYDQPAKSDGARILVDRLWPRGLTKEDAQVEAWLRDLAPSNELRKWFHLHREQWAEFRRRYLSELRSPAAMKAVDQLYELISNNRTVTLVFASKELERNNAIVLKELITGMKRPPTGSGEARAAEGRRKRASRPRSS